MESKTPRTDAALFVALGERHYDTKIVTNIDFARQLETELVKANELLLKTNQAHIENQQLRKDLDGEREINPRLTDELAEARAEAERLNTDYAAFSDKSKAVCLDYMGQIKRKSALIEQMRKKIGFMAKQKLPSEISELEYMQACFGDAYEMLVIEARKLEAALSAAERGG